MSHELVTLGEAMLRFSVSPGSRLEDASMFQVAVAGAEANVAVGVARMGHRAAWISRLPDSALGRRAAREIGAHGVDVSHVRWVDGERLGTYFIEQAVPPGAPRIIYDRSGSAAAGMTVDDVSWEVVEAARVFHISGITPALSPSAREMAVEAVRRAREGGVVVSVDVNYRSRLWPPEAARPGLVELSRGADLVIVAERDARRVFEVGGDPIEVARRLQEDLGAGSLILTRGGEGSVWRLGGREGETPPYRARVLDRIGAGDAFAAGVLVGILRGDPELGIRYGTAMAALELGWEGDQFWGDQAEVERIIGEEDPEVRR